MEAFIVNNGNVDNLKKSVWSLSASIRNIGITVLDYDTKQDGYLSELATFSVIKYKKIQNLDILDNPQVLGKWIILTNGDTWIHPGWESFFNKLSKKSVGILNDDPSGPIDIIRSPFIVIHGSALKMVKGLEFTNNKFKLTSVSAPNLMPIQIPKKLFMTIDLEKLKTTNPKIEVVISTYNRKEYLERCVWSVLFSTDNVKVIVVNDCSRNDTSTFLDNLSKMGLVTHLKNAKNMGTAYTLNRGISSAKGTWVTFTNDDFWFLPGWYEKCQEIVENYSDCGIISFHQGCILSPGKVIRAKTSGCASTFLNKELFNKAGKFRLPTGKKMGVFAGDFCKRAARTKLPRNRFYIPETYWSLSMEFSNTNWKHGSKNMLSLGKMTDSKLLKYFEFRLSQRNGGVRWDRAFLSQSWIKSNK